jgi:hypothetical protein
MAHLFYEPGYVILNVGNIAEESYVSIVEYRHVAKR